MHASTRDAMRRSRDQRPRTWELLQKEARKAPEGRLGRRQGRFNAGVDRFARPGRRVMDDCDGTGQSEQMQRNRERVAIRRTRYRGLIDGDLRAAAVVAVGIVIDRRQPMSVV